MDKKRKPEPDDKEQSARFVETAKALEVDKTGKAFNAFVKVLARKPEKRPSSKAKRPE